MTRVTPTTFLILSEPPRRTEPPGLGFNAIKPPQQTPVPIMAHRLTPTQNQQPLPDSTIPAMASASVPVSGSEPHLAGNQVGGGTRTRRQQKPDDLVPPGCGLTRSDIVELPIDDFNDKVAEKDEKEILVLKDRRRRGKNRIAAKRSREKKMERLRLLKVEYQRLTRKDKEVNRERQVALSNKDAVLYHLNKMEFEIKRLRDKMWRMQRCS